MPLNQNEVNLLRWLANADESPTSQSAAVQVSLPVKEVEFMFNRFCELGYAQSWGFVLERDASNGIGIAPAGREAIRDFDDRQHSTLMRCLRKHYWRVIILILVGGASLYYVAWRGLGKH